MKKNKRPKKTPSIEKTETIPQESKDDSNQKPKKTIAQILTDLVINSAELFHDGNRAFVTVPFNQTYPVNSQSFNARLRSMYHLETGNIPNYESFRAAINTIEALAIMRGPQIKTFVRIAELELEHAIYIDLANDDAQAIKITPDGWHIINQVPVKFIRIPGMKSLPLPSEGNFDLLKQLLNLNDNIQLTLMVAWLIGAAKPDGPYPVLILSGEHGTAKSTTARILKSIFDPSELLLRSEPREERDLAISAQKNHILSYDNLSTLPSWLSDCFCRLSTGGGFGIRQLYTDDSEVNFKSTRPLIINSITDIATRPDLLDRAIIVTLPTIPDEARKLESELKAKFTELHPQLLGALCSALSDSLKNHKNIRLPKLPRMADFAIWVTAAESALGWKSGHFLSCFDGNRKSINELALEASPVSAVLYKLLNKKNPWRGNASSLLTSLQLYADDSAKKESTFPKTGHGLSGVLRRLAPNLRAIGIHINFLKDGHRTIELTKDAPQEAKAKRGNGHDTDAERQSVSGASVNLSPRTDTIYATDVPKPSLGVSLLNRRYRQ